MREVLGLRELGAEEAEAGADEVVAQGGAALGRESVDGGAGSVRLWRVRAAAGVVIALFVGVGYMLTVGRAPDADPAGVAEGPAVPALAGEPVEEVEEAARAALSAWARFADTGDVEQLGPTFDRGGPQFARLRAEAPGVAARTGAGAPYAFMATGMQVGAGSSEDERVVVADVVVSRAGEADQRFAWDLVMRKSDGRWRLWTVREREGFAGDRPGGRS